MPKKKRQIDVTPPARKFTAGEIIDTPEGRKEIEVGYGMSFKLTTPLTTDTRSGYWWTRSDFYEWGNK